MIVTTELAAARDFVLGISLGMFALFCAFIVHEALTMPLPDCSPFWDSATRTYFQCD